MSTTDDFHQAKMALESALVDFQKAVEEDGRDMLDELVDVVVDSCNDKYDVVEK